jgi:hypothetical protein
MHQGCVRSCQRRWGGSGGVVADIARLSVGREAYYTRELATDHEQYLSGHGESPERWYGAGDQTLAIDTPSSLDLRRLSTRELRAERDRLCQLLDQAPRDRTRELQRASVRRAEADQALAQLTTTSDPPAPGARNASPALAGGRRGRRRRGRLAGHRPGRSQLGGPGRGHGRGRVGLAAALPQLPGHRGLAARPGTAHRRLLASLERQGWAVLHDLAIPGSAANPWAGADSLAGRPGPATVPSRRLTACAREHPKQPLARLLVGCTRHA